MVGVSKMGKKQKGMEGSTFTADDEHSLDWRVLKTIWQYFCRNLVQIMTMREINYHNRVVQRPLGQDDKIVQEFFHVGKNDGPWYSDHMTFSDKFSMRHIKICIMSPDIDSSMKMAVFE